MGCGLSKYCPSSRRGAPDSYPLTSPDAPVAHTVQASTATRDSPARSARASNDEDNKEDPVLNDLRQRCDRFRILVIGKANAGKTTILQKMCNTTEAPLIYNKDGAMIDQSVIEPTDGRGIHDINNELTFSSNTAFVFHDSPGFEAGSVRELEDVHEFIAKRGASNDLKDQLHAIWYCLPTDNDRPLTNAEISFFEQGTGKTPVIAIFTKYDGMILKEYNRLRFEEGQTKAKAMALAPKLADELFLDSHYYLKRVQGAAHPPTRWLRLQAMNRPESNCNDLSRQTLKALNSKILQQLFVLVQKNNIELSTEWIIKNVVTEALQKVTDQSSFMEIVEVMNKEILTCYGHLFLSQDYSKKYIDHLDNEGKARHWQDRADLDSDDHEMLGTLEMVIPALAGQGHISFQICSLATAFLIVAEDSLWLIKDGRPHVAAFKLALANYQESERHKAVIKEIDENFNQAIIQSMVSGEEGEVEGHRMMLELVKKFRL